MYYNLLEETENDHFFTKCFFSDAAYSHCDFCFQIYSVLVVSVGS
jgi:hypothetical protein